jgi:hypothetical protein
MARKKKGESGVVDPSQQESQLIDVEKQPSWEDSPIQPVVTRMIEQAIQNYEENLEPAQAEATRYYKGEPFGDEQDGRSKVVSTDLRDSVEAVLPSLMRIFAGTERPVEFAPDGPEDVAVAEQQTDYVSHIVMEQNPGFLVQYEAFKDALVRRLGIIKWWTESFYRVERRKVHGLTPEALAIVVSEGDATLEGIEVGEDGLMSASISHKKSDAEPCFKIASVPNDEFLISADATCLEDATLTAHVRDLPVDYVVGLVGDEHREFVESVKGKTKGTASTDLEHARRHDSGFDDDDEDGRDESQQLVKYAEAYVLVDADKDGTAELRMCQCVGPQYKILNGKGLGEIVDERPFALFSPIPEPHTVIGQSYYDLLKDIQRIKSQIWRGTLDSLAIAIEPKTEVVTGEVNMGDLLNPEVNNIIRVRKPGMMREIKHSFVGPDTLPVLATLDEVRADRTGHTKASEGLDADVLQSTTKSAVSATMTKAQQRTEMIARIFAETGIKQMYRGLLKMIVANPPRKDMVRLRGQYVEVDPRTWNAEKDVTINVALGAGLVEEKLASLSQIAADQIQLQQAGSPLVSTVEVRNVRSKFAELLGWKDVDKFYKKWGQQEEMQMQQMLANQPPPPSPEMALVEVENQKAQANTQIKIMELEMKREDMMLRNDLERDRLAREMALKEHEIELKHQKEIIDSKLKAQVAADRAQMDADLKREQVNSQPAAE